MQHTRSTRAAGKTSREFQPSARTDGSPGANGYAVKPPSYGMAFADHVLTTGPERPALHAAPVLQAKPMAPGELSPILAKGADRDGGAAASGQVSSADGAELPEGVRGKMERAFGLNFSAVRVHEGHQALAAGAAAFTQGTNIHFASEQYQPHSQAGQELLGHELTHVVQQAQGRVPTTTRRAGAAINDDPRLEQEADVSGARAARGEIVGDAGPASPKGVTGPDALQASPTPALISSDSSAGVMQQRSLGRAYFKRIMGDRPEDDFAVWTSSVDEWKAFLEDRADEDWDSVRLTVFLALAVGRTELRSQWFYADLTNMTRPTESEAIDLMSAFLTVGSDIDLPDHVGEGNNIATDLMSPLLQEFNKEFANGAIKRIRERGDFDNETFDAIKAYTEVSSNMRLTASHLDRNTPDPTPTLISVAVATAVEAATTVYECGQDPNRNSEKGRAYNLAHDAGMVVGASFEQMHEAAESTKAFAMTAFDSAVGLMSGPLNPVASSFLGALSPLVKHGLEQAFDKDTVSGRRKIKDEYRNAVNKMIYEKGFNSTDANVTITRFLDGVGY